VPISATEIRRHIWGKHFQYRSFIADEVYKDLVSKIVFLGAPSTGKSTLCRALADKHQTLWVSEYGRDYWLEHQINRRLSPQQLLHIAQTQVDMEDQLAVQANRYLFCDTNAFTTWHFAIHYHNQALPELEALAEQSWQRYALVVLCDVDIQYDDTWERSGDTNRMDFQAFIKRYLDSHKIPYLLVSGSVEHRIAMIEEKMHELT